MPATHSGCLIQSTFGSNGNFEIVFASPRGGLSHFWRDNDAADLAWVGPHLFGAGAVSSPSLVQTFLGSLEVIVCAGNQLAAYTRTDRWRGPTYFGVDVTGNPAAIQGDDGELHMVVPALNGGFTEFQRPASPEAAWETVQHFKADAGHAISVALIRSNYGEPGNLEAVAVMDSGEGPFLAHFWRDDAGSWHGPQPIATTGLPGGAAPAGVPAFIQSRHGSKGHFEVVVPLSTGGLAHFRRDNDSADLPWNLIAAFGTGVFSSVGMTQSNFGSLGLGNFELVGRVDNRIEHYFCQDELLQWFGPAAVIDSEPLEDKSLIGEWFIEHTCEPVGIHAALLHTNKVLFFAYDEHNQMHGVSSVFNFDDGTLEHVEQEEDLFCAGHAFLADGRLLVAGGHVTGEKTMFLFTPDGSSGAWQQLPDMPEGRWYPTCTTLPDGTVFVYSGAKQSGGGPVNDTYQIFDPQTGLQPPQPAPFLNEAAPCNTYPWVFVLPAGKLLLFSYNKAWLFDLAMRTFGTEQFTCLRDEPRTYPLEGTGILLPLLPDSDPPYRARVMVIGGGGLPLDTLTPATTSCEILDLTVAAPQWKNAAQLPVGRVMPDAVILPDATVLVMNGSSTGKADDAVNPVLETEIYEPASDTWKPAASMRVPRLYHSTALLLPDGTVMTAGLDEAFNAPPFKYPEYRLEIFRPPYLFRGPRPQIDAAPLVISYFDQFLVLTPDEESIVAAALLRAGSVTHSFNMDQRYVGLQITSRSPGALTLEAPPNGNIAPPGYYLLFLLNGLGVPSKGRFIQIDPMVQS